jgi:hypothetical protein
MNKILIKITPLKSIPISAFIFLSIVLERFLYFIICWKNQYERNPNVFLFNNKQIHSAFSNLGVDKVQINYLRYIIRELT